MELTLFVDHQCNLRCTYCYNGEKFGRRMSRETMVKAVDLALKGSPDQLHVSFFGGEPMLRLDFLKESVRHIEEKLQATNRKIPYLFIVNTNGTLISDDAISMMKASPFAVNISLDGPQEIHDKVRLTTGGKSTFSTIVKGLDRLKAEKVPFQLLAVVTPESARFLGRTVATMLDLGPERAQLSIDYRANWTDENIAELTQGLRDAGDVWIERFRQGKAIPLNPLHSKVLSHLKGGMPCPSRCLLANGEFTVAPSGNLYPCGQMVGEDKDVSLVIGHVDTGIDPSLTGKLQTAKDRINETCATCDLQARCQSQCGCKHVALTGELGSITAALCETEAAFVAEADRVAEILYAENNPTFMGYYYKRNWSAAKGAKLIELRRSKTPLAAN